MSASAVMAISFCSRPVTRAIATVCVAERPLVSTVAIRDPGLSRLRAGSVSPAPEAGSQFPDRPVREAAAWGTAMNFCLGARYGGRGGWRLPSMEELTSLIDANREFPPLPSGHPFDLSELTGDVWSATTVPGTAEAYTQDMIRDGFLGSLPKTGQRATWCVRGGRGIDGQ
jgi:hypothetical protein